jgi:hypothetical protein
MQQNDCGLRPWDGSVRPGRCRDAWKFFAHSVCEPVGHPPPHNSQPPNQPPNASGLLTDDGERRKTSANRFMFYQQDVRDIGEHRRSSARKGREDTLSANLQYIAVDL